MKEEGGHHCTFLHGRFAEELPEVLAHLKELTLQSDAAQGWGLVDADGEPSLTV